MLSPFRELYIVTRHIHHHEAEVPLDSALQHVSRAGEQNKADGVSIPVEDDDLVTRHLLD